MEVNLKAFSDTLGPSKVLFIREPHIGLEAIIIVDNTAAGPSIGGVRMSPNVSPEEVFRLARAMTLKNAAAGLPHGGGKSGIKADPFMGYVEKEKLMRSFARLIADFEDYIPGPDMGTNEQCMAWVKDEMGRAVGLPEVLGGIPLDEIGATAFGLSIAAEVAAPAVGLRLEGSNLAVQGFGAVGKHTAKFLAKRGSKLVAASDSQGAIYNAEGLNLAALIEHKENGLSVHNFPEGKAISHEELLAVECDIWVPAAQPDELTRENVSALKASLVLQGANIPATEAAEVYMHGHGILNIPDFIANAGGVICGAVEYRGGNEQQALDTIEIKLRANTTELLERLKLKNELPREAALEMALDRVKEAMTFRRS